MSRPLLKVVIVGHVDHGKSTLIGRLLLETHGFPGERIALAHRVDQFKEERENDMTIDTTQAFFKTRQARYALIDSPGHVKFIKNMLTGATQADAAVLVVDVLEGLKEQTNRHAFLMKMLGVKRLLVVLNKMDRVEYGESFFAAKKIALMKFFEHLNVRPLNIIPVSATEGANVSKKSRRTRWYQGPTLLEALDALTPTVRSDRDPLRFSVQDVYEIAGQAIIAGQVLTGRIAAGQEVTLLPSFRTAAIQSIKVFGKAPKRAGAGENIGLTFKKSLSVSRGEVIVENDGRLVPTTRFSGNVFWLSDLPLKVDAPVTLRCATQELNGRVTGIRNRMDSSTLEILEKDARQLNAQETGAVTFATERPAVVEEAGPLNGLGRFVIEQGLQPQGVGIISRSE